MTSEKKRKEERQENNLLNLTKRTTTGNTPEISCIASLYSPDVWQVMTIIRVHYLHEVMFLCTSRNMFKVTCSFNIRQNLCL